MAVGPVRVLRGLDSVRLRPAMYVGDVDDGSGLHRLIEMAVLDALARGPTLVAVTLRADGTVEVADDGAPFPADVAAALSGLMMYEPGLLAPVSALSSRFEVRQRRDGAERLTRFADGRLVAPTVRRETGAAEDGFAATFLAAAGIFGTVVYDRALVARGLRDLARREPGTRLRLM